jgi:protein gp37
MRYFSQRNAAHRAEGGAPTIRRVSGKTSIEWATRSWNPTTGCKRVSAGCDNCYAFQLHDQRYVAWSRGRMPMAATQYHVPYSRLQLLPRRLDDPQHWNVPELVFVDSMADLMWEQVPDAYIDRVFETMERVDRHVYQILTKRPERMLTYVGRRYGSAGAPAHIWLGTSVEDMRVAGRVKMLRRVPAHIRFLSCEPLLGSLRDLDLTGIHWVIAGGESGIRRRPVEKAWVRELRQMCLDAGIAFFFKQWGGLRPKDAGRRLDGREWSEYPRCEGLKPTANARRLRKMREISRVQQRREAVAG